DRLTPRSMLRCALRVAEDTRDARVRTAAMRRRERIVEGLAQQPMCERKLGPRAARRANQIARDGGIQDLHQSRSVTLAHRLRWPSIGANARSAVLSRCSPSVATNRMRVRESSGIR